MSFASEVLADSPVWFYRMADASGTQCTDATANARHGTYSGGVTLQQPSLVVPDTGSDYAVAVDGVDGTITSLLYGPIAAVPTFMVAFQPVAGFGDNVPLFWLRCHYTNGVTLYGGVWLSRVGGYITIDDSSNRPSSIKLNGIPRKRILHATWAYPTVTLYLDGQQIFQTGQNLRCDNTDELTVFFGRNNSGQYFQGILDECAMFPSSLSAARIAAHAAEFKKQDKTREATHQRLLRARRSFQQPVRHIGI